MGNSGGAELAQFQSALEQHTPLQERFSHSKEFLQDVRKELGCLTAGQAEALAIFAGGSLGRYETGRKSDIDLFLIAQSPVGTDNQKRLSHLDEITYLADLIQLNEKLELPKLSGDGRYLQIHQVDQLIRLTGSPRDDSENLFTTRILLLLESQWVSNQTLYNDSLTRVCEHYFRDQVGKNDFQPLFLLNDLLRYWRTVCLNYEQDRNDQRKPWWKKNLNLKFSRKLTVFSTVLALVTGKIVTVAQLRELCDRVPLERLAFALDTIKDESLLPGFQTFLPHYESFLAAKSHAELEQKRAEVIQDLRDKAQQFSRFLHTAFHSEKLDPAIVQYVLI